MLNQHVHSLFQLTLLCKVCSTGGGIPFVFISIFLFDVNGQELVNTLRILNTVTASSLDG